MAFRPVPNGIEVALHARCDAQELVNTFGFRSTGAAPTNAQVIAAVQDIQADFLPLYQLLCHSDVNFYKIVGTALDTATSYQYIVEISENGAITASERLPLNVSCCVSIKGSVRGRGRQGRLYTFGMTEGWVNGDLIVPGYTDDLTIAFNTLPLVSTSPGIQWAVLSRAHALATPVASFACKAPVASQVDRLPGHRRHHRHP